VELLTGGVFLITYLHIGKLNWELGVMLALWATLITLAGVDLDFKEVPDSLNLLALTLSFFSSPHFLENFTNALLMIGGAGLVRYYSALLFRREALGEGDLIMAGTMGGVVGVKLAVIAFVLANFLALPVALYQRATGKGESVPFIPFMVAALFIVWLFQPQFLGLWSYLYG
jgi:leader peptidase (prepilin peptidase)/N-methyltransferase